MSKTKILQELPKLDSVERREIRDRIWQIEEEELLSGRAHPSSTDKELLDRELEDYLRDRNAGSSWEEVESRLKN
ncbi:MAG TPA: hypothetical protein VF511_02805 [Chthoniobacterales bacterium]